MNLDEAFDKAYAESEPERIKFRDAFPRKEYELPVHRNDVLEEVAREFERMPFGDTAASFAVFVRNMKR